MKATGIQGRWDSGCHWEGTEASAVSREKMIISTRGYLAVQVFPTSRFPVPTALGRD